MFKDLGATGTFGVSFEQTTSAFRSPRTLKVNTFSRPSDLQEVILANRQERIRIAEADYARKQEQDMIDEVLRNLED